LFCFPNKSPIGPPWLPMLKTCACILSGFVSRLTRLCLLFSRT
jgi:hypothetical protein